MTEDAVDLLHFSQTRDEEAFRNLVTRHFELVYGTALRVTNGDTFLAEDVTQTVFADLARKAGSLVGNRVLASWLYQATRFAAAKAIRTEQRRRYRERQAFAMENLSKDTSPDWERLVPLLDAALGKLKSKDRDAILLHFFEQRNFRAVGAALGLSDDAAQKRVSRALEKLRLILVRHGVSIAGSSLSAFLNAQILPIAPAGLASSVAKGALVRAAAIGPLNWSEAFRNKVASAKIKLAVTSVSIVLLGIGLVHFSRANHRAVPQAFVTINLSSYVNGELDKSWTPVYGNNHLAALGVGRHVLNSVPFDLRGVIQLQGTEWRQRSYKFPDKVQQIRVGTTGRKIHLLHANSAFDDPAGTTVASLVLHFADGESAQFDIRQGIEVLDWWEWPGAAVKQPRGTNTIVAWKGKNPPAEHQGARVRLFDTAFVNPYPEKEIQSLDYISAMAGSAPFMAALTIEL
jgi:RNA polymerase sigma factor (sigma-70 family)